MENASRLTRDGTGRPNLSRVTKFSSANGDRDHQQDWQPYRVDPYPAIIGDHRGPAQDISDVN